MSAPATSESHRPIATIRQRSAPTATPRDRRVFVGVVVLAVLSVGGAVISVAGGLSSTIWEAMGPTGRLSIPIPMMLAQLAAAWLAAGSRRRPALLASALLALVEPICIISGFYDGGYGDPDRSSLLVAYQILFVAAIAVVGVLAALRFSALVRRRD
jgi:peptidoglycan/LPS O-acetylase OafA/YrhL